MPVTRKCELPFSIVTRSLQVTVDPAKSQPHPTKPGAHTWTLNLNEEAELQSPGSRGASSRHLSGRVKPHLKAAFFLPFL